MSQHIEPPTKSKPIVQNNKLTWNCFPFAIKLQLKQNPLMQCAG